MQPRGYALSLLLALVTAAVAVALQRRWPQRLFASRLASLGLGLVSLLAYSNSNHVLKKKLLLPPLPGTEAALEAEPWEAVCWPFLALCIAWPLTRVVAKRSSAIQLWIALLLATIPLLAALTRAERYSEFVPGNAYWSIAVLLAIGLNWLVVERMNAVGAGRWSLWVSVAQACTVSALYMTCYGTLGEWCMIVTLTLGIFAAARVFLPDGEWSGDLMLPAIALNCVLLMHIRDYSPSALPYWLAPLPLLLPAIVGAVDQTLGKRDRPLMRVVLAAMVAAAVGAATIVTTLSLSGSGQQW